MAYTPLADLQLDSFGWQARVRLVKKTVIAPYSNRRTHQPGVRCSFEFIDEDATKMTATAFDAFCVRWHERLIVDGVYILSGTAIRKAYAAADDTAASSVELTFTRFTDVVAVAEPANFPTVAVTFLSLQQVAEKREICSVNVIGWIVEIGPLEDVFSHRFGRELKKRDVFIVDRSYNRNQIAVTVWGDVAETMDPAVHGVLKILGGMVSLYGGGVSINTTHSTEVTLNGNDAVSIAVRNWHEDFVGGLGRQD